ncbi:MAG: metallopeptidase family protein [Oscillospiraceae bacterium]|nr:metallopeptidase family protein [Oscillospiraceae bacterium]
MIPIDRVHEMLEQIAAEFPPEFYEKLNGGISLLPEAKRSPYARGDDLYILGEYCRDMMGRQIYIYYGSFLRAHGHKTEPEFYKELRKTVSHEFTHHLEDLAGERGLEVRDREELEDYLYDEEDR